VKREARARLTRRRRSKLNEEVRIVAGSHILPILILLSRSPLTALLGIRSLRLAYGHIYPTTERRP